MNPVELAIHRKGTSQFIAKDSTELVLIPSGEVEINGSKSFVDSTPRIPQLFKFIYPGGNGVSITSDGITHKFDFILVGEYDATVAIGDHWAEGEQFYQIEWVAPYNEYEVKAGGTTHGANADHG